MQYQITSDNMDITESMKELVYKKAQKLERHWSDANGDNILVRIVLNSAPEETFLVKIDANVDGERFYTEEPGYALETALVEAIEEMVRKYGKSTEKREEKEWEARREGKALTEEDLEIEMESEMEDIFEDLDDELDDDEDLDENL